MELIAIASVQYNETKIMEINMKKSLLLCLILIVIAGSMLAACSGSASTSLVGDWKLISYGSTPALPDTETSLVFDAQNKVSGNVGCNSFSGDYTVDGDKVTFSAITSTLMACADPIMEQESAVLKSLVDTATFNISGNTLTITSANGGSVAVFEHK